MCSFIATNRTITDIDDVNYFTKFRGPDQTVRYERDGYTFVHNILSITGQFTTQPFESDDVVCLYNGEIYNYRTWGDYASDGECLIPLYREYGTRFPQLLDGEFAIVLIDFAARRLVISTDVFATKPLWVALEGTAGFATYESCLTRLGFRSPTKIPANEIRVYSLDTYALLETRPVYAFDLTQYKTDCSDWVRAFESSIRKRTENIRERVFIGLSSGYDSGAISCELNKQHVPYTAFSVVGQESDTILAARAARIPAESSIQFLPDTRWEHQEYINTHVEEFKYRIYSSSSSYNEFNRRLQDDNGSCGLSLVCHHAQQQQLKIYLSGSGADEIFSDYGFNGQKFFPHSNFGGRFPARLEDIFPWASFYDSTMISYLAKEEYVAGSYGIETRYPYLDPQVVQEFLWLDHTVKNQEYKSPLDFYLRTNDYPYEHRQKRGF